MFDRRVYATLIFIVSVSGLSAGMWLAGHLTSGKGVPQIAGLLWPNPKSVSPFQLIDQKGRPFNLEQLKGKWSFMYFGYTHCPDICPLTLQTLNVVIKKLAPDVRLASSTRVVMATVDPERDTQQQLAVYLAYFNPHFVGLTGTEAQMEAFTRDLGIVRMKIIEPGKTDYHVDHSASILLVDPAARLVGSFSPPHSAEVIAREYRDIRSFIERQT
ncbi:MAG TPA: SCO family protein [Gammaproteobacteria bacterium]|nr:SCO family protein [Gammaproteobacteria bacterium]